METYLPPLTPMLSTDLEKDWIFYSARTVCTEIKGKAKKKAVRGKTTAFAGICPSMKESLFKVSVPDSSGYSLKGLEPVILTETGKICLC